MSTTRVQVTVDDKLIKKVKKRIEEEHLNLTIQDLIQIFLKKYC